MSASASSTESPTQRLDRLLHTAAAPLSGGLSPVSLALALADWGWHLAVSPGRQLELAALAAETAARTWIAPAGPEPAAADAEEDPRYRDPAWQHWPFASLRRGAQQAEAFWHEAASVPGMSAHHAQMTQFFARQWLAMLAPANWLLSNPVALRDAISSNGAHLASGLQHWLADAGRQTPPVPAGGPFRVGNEVAVTPGKVVHRNHLIELIRYEPQTAKVWEEPVFIMPSWIMKYYILDLSPHNSLVRYLVGQGYTVYMLSWRNPDAADHDLSMEDYLKLGVLDPLQAIGRQSAKVGGQPPAVQAMGYCLGGTLLAMAAAALATGAAELLGYRRLPALRSLTLLAAQTDFSEPGELGLFIDESQVGLLDELTRGPGYLSGQQMAGSFQFLHARDLVWARRLREYLLGEREQANDLMAWNSDTTRLPARMHHEYLSSLYLHNALANGNYRLDGHLLSLGALSLPIFLVGTEHDHVSPWPSVYKLHHLCQAEICFVLASGGHNAGIIAAPGQARRSYRSATRAAHGEWIESKQWLARAEVHEGSWWPAWSQWLAAQASRQTAARNIPATAILAEAPGNYVRQCYAD